MLSSSTKAICLRALSNHLGDDLYRAQHAFGRMSDKDLNSQYGQSGKTPRQILAGYQEHNDTVQAAIDEIKRS